MEDELTPVQSNCFETILAAGDAKAYFAEAIQNLIANDPSAYETAYNEGIERMNEAHRFEAELMQMYGTDPSSVPADLLVIHANDHLSMALTMQELCDQLKPVIETVNELKAKL